MIDEEARDAATSRASEAFSPDRVEVSEETAPIPSVVQRTRLRPAPALYRLLIAELDRRRRERGLSMQELDDRTGCADRYFAKCSTPDEPCGRQASLGMLDAFSTALFPKGLELKLVDPSEAEGTALPIGDGTAARVVRHWRHRRYFAEIGRKGGLASAQSVDPEARRAWSRRGALKRWGKEQAP